MILNPAARSWLSIERVLELVISCLTDEHALSRTTATRATQCEAGRWITGFMEVLNAPGWLGPERPGQKLTCA